MDKSYKIVLPNDMTEEHIDFINDYKNSIYKISKQFDIILGAKDANSRHIISTDSYAKIVGLNAGDDVADRLDKEMPCEGTSQYADCYVKEDQSLLETLDPSQVISILNVHNYEDGLKARIFKKKILCHEATKSILGTIYSATDIDLKGVINLIPNYVIKFGAIGSLSVGNVKKLLNVELTEYEQEICFLLLLHWEFKQIADFMNEIRPDDKHHRMADTIIKKKNYICEKLELTTTHVSELQDFLISVGFHNQMPKSFYYKIIGSTLL